MSRKPNIRFQGFSSEWKVLPLGELGEFKSNGVDKKVNPDEHPVNLLNYLDVYNKRHITAKNCVELMHVTANSRQLKENDVQEGDVFFTPSSETPEDIGRVKVIEETLPNTVYSYHLMRFRRFDDTLQKIFPEYALETDDVRRQMFLAAQGAQRFVISKPAFEQIKISFPEFAEQAKISAFFRSLDELLEGKQEELDKRRQLKAALLAQMFPTEGAGVPRVRFKGFNEPWQKASLVDLFDLSIKHYSHSRDYLTNTHEQVATIHYGDILVKYGNVVTFDEDDIPYIVSSRVDDYRSASLQDGDVIMADTAEDEVAGKVIEIRNIGDNCIVAGLHTIAARPKVEFAPYYCGYFFNSPLYHNQLLPLMQGIKVLSINKPALEPTLVYYPSSLEEQGKIGKLLYDLDASIRGIIEQMQKLRKIKKALSDGMLI